MFSAYTIRKVLPRLLIAIILIQLSWFLVIQVVKLNNDIAHGLESLAYAPFGGISKFDLGSIIQQNGGSATAFSSGVFSAAAAGTIAFVAIGSGSVVGILALAGTAVLGILIAVFTLILRRAVLLFLILLAPLAMVAWVLPGTERFWKLWWESFTKLLIMYPLILLLLASGRIFAYVSAQISATPLLTFAMIILGYFGPLFLIPATLKLAGTAFTTLTSAVNSRNKGAFDRLRNVRQKEGQKNRQDAAAGNRFKGNNALSRGASGALFAASMAPKAGFKPSRMRANYSSAAGARKFDLASEFMEKNSAFQSIKSDDDKLWALMEGHDAASIKSVLKDRGGDRFKDERVLNAAAAEIMRIQREGGADVARIAATRAQATTGTGYNYGKDGDDMLQAINRASGSDRTTAGRMLAEMRGAAMQSGRVDLGAAGFAVMAQNLDRLREADANGGFVVEKDADGNKVERKFGIKEAREAVMDSVIDSSGASQAIYGKPTSAAALGQAHVRKIQNIVQSLTSGQPDANGKMHTERDLSQALAASAGILDAMGQASPQNARAFSDELMNANILTAGVPSPSLLKSLGVPEGQSGVTIQQAISGLRDSNDPTFNQMRREYGSSTLANAEAEKSQRLGLVPGVSGMPGRPQSGPPGPQG